MCTETAAAPALSPNNITRLHHTMRSRCRYEHLHRESIPTTVTATSLLCPISASAHQLPGVSAESFDVLAHPMHGQLLVLKSCNCRTTWVYLGIYACMDRHKETEETALNSMNAGLEVRWVGRCASRTDQRCRWSGRGRVRGELKSPSCRRCPACCDMEIRE